MSPLVRGAWIENLPFAIRPHLALSPLVRGAWIEKRELSQRRT